MKKNIYHAYVALQKSQGKLQEVVFKHTNNLGTKTVEAIISQQKNEKPTLQITASSGYSPSYINRSLKQNLFDLYEEAELELPASGDTIYLTNPLSPAVNIGDIIEIPAYTQYYAVNSSPIDCNGRQLPISFEGEYVDDENSTCKDGGTPTWYHLFKLQ